MRKIVGWTLIALALVIPVTGCSSGKKTAPVQAPSASTLPAPGGSPSTKSSNGLPGELPGDKAALRTALSEKSAVQYEIVTIDEAGIRDKDAHFDTLLAQKNWPESSMLVVAVYTQDNYDFRYAMGGIFNEKKVAPTDMYALIKEHYQPKARSGDPSAGLAALIKAVNSRMAQ
ncbi:MAG TPA: hypothetical protein VD969_02120 [Symbiobacteriaceae bacterium]|nr:hypothetical protein [Symbiobacteriaceae bacterium]